MPAAQNEFEAIMAISQQIEDMSDQENPYTSLTKQVKYLVTVLALQSSYN